MKKTIKKNFDLFKQLLNNNNDDSNNNNNSNSNNIALNVSAAKRETFPAKERSVNDILVAKKEKEKAPEEKTMPNP